MLTKYHRRWGPDRGKIPSINVSDQYATSDHCCGESDPINGHVGLPGGGHKTSLQTGGRLPLVVADAQLSGLAPVQARTS